MTRSFRFAAALLLGLALSACGTANTNYVTGESQRGAYSWQQEVQIGTEADQQISAQFGLYDDARVTSYVERVANDVLQTSAYTDPNTPAEIRNTPFHFRVLDSPVVNAFALPGGYIYVTRGLLSYLENEAQLAVVLGHEIGHVLARHSSEQAARAQTGQLGLLLGAAVGGVVGGGRVAQGILDYGSQGVGLLFLKYGRGAEREADQAGVAYAKYAGYDAAQASRFFVSLARLSQGSERSLPNFLSTHPDPGEREVTIRQLAAQYPGGTEVDAAAFLQAIEGIVIGDDPRQGFVENSTFYHPELRFAFDIPRGWNVQNTPQAVVLQQPNNQAALQMTLSQQSSAQAAAQAFGAQQGVQVSDTRRVDANGNTAVRVEGRAAQQSGNLAFSATFIEYGGNVYQLLGIAPEAGFSSQASTLRGVASSFRRLTEARYLNREASRLDVTTTRGSTTLQALLQDRTLPTGLTADEVAIMNQTQLNTSLPAGTTVKLPGR